MKGQRKVFVGTQGFFDIVGYISHENAFLICHGDFKVFPFKTPFYHMSKKHLSIPTSSCKLSPITGPSNVEYGASIGFLQAVGPLYVEKNKRKMLIKKAMIMLGTFRCHYPHCYSFYYHSLTPVLSQSLNVLNEPTAKSWPAIAIVFNMLDQPGI